MDSIKKIDFRDNIFFSFVDKNRYLAFKRWDLKFECTLLAKQFLYRFMFETRVWHVSYKWPSSWMIIRESGKFLIFLFITSEYLCIYRRYSEKYISKSSCYSRLFIFSGKAFECNFPEWYFLWKSGKTVKIYSNSFFFFFWRWKIHFWKSFAVDDQWTRSRAS